VPDDVLVIGKQQVMRQLGPVKEELQALVKARYAVLVEFLEGRVPHVLGQVLKRRHAEEVKHPVDQHQPVFEFETGRLGDTATGRLATG